MRAGLAHWPLREGVEVRGLTLLRRLARLAFRELAGPPTRMQP